MTRRFAAPLAAVTLFAGLVTSAFAQAPPDPTALLDAQHEAMSALAWMDGAWRGDAWALGPGGKKTMTHTERIGPLLGGTVKVIEGHSYPADGSRGFNALGIVSFDPATKSYSMRSYAQGRSGDFTLVPTATGYSWEIPAGPGAVIRYTATIKDGIWHEAGDRMVDGKDAMRIFEMTLTRLGDSAWPAGGAVPPK